MRYSVIFRWTREKDSVGSVESVSWTDTSSQSTGSVNRRYQRGAHGSNWEIWDPSLWQNKQPQKHQRSKARAVFKKSRSLANIPPTRVALVNHAKRAVFQGGFVWQQTLLKEPVIPCPSQWGWQREESVWVPHWTALQQAKDSCYELIHFGCKTVCRGRCKCVKANLACTGLCN